MCFWTGWRVRWGISTKTFYPEIRPELTGKSCHLRTTQSGVYRNQKVVFVTRSARDQLGKEEQHIRIDRLNCYSTQGTAIEVIQHTRHWVITGIPFPLHIPPVWQRVTHGPSDRPEAEAIMKSTSESSCTAIVTGIHLSLRHSNIPVHIPDSLETVLMDWLHIFLSIVDCVDCVVIKQSSVKWQWRA